MGYVVQEGDDCIVHLKGVVRSIKGSTIVKLANTIWDRPGSKYTEEEMRKFGFVLEEDMSCKVSKRRLKENEMGYNRKICN